MRKRLIGPIAQSSPVLDQHWLDVAQLAQVEVTSEDASHPIEAALVPGQESGWRAADGGEQTIRLLFDRPQRLTRVWLLFIESDTPRTQEFVLRWAPSGARSVRDILRQQWTFGPPETIREVEDYRIDLADAAVLELVIIPDRSGGGGRASLAQWRIA
jgi:hypothetical protein